VVVLGGGLAGLSVAHEILGKRDCELVIIEKGSRPGGMALSLEWDGMRSDLGPHRIHSSIPEMRQWFRDILGDNLISVRRSSRMYVEGRYIKYPPAARQLLSVFGPLRLAHFAAGYARDSLLYRKDAGSFADVMLHSFGRPMCEALVFPYIRKTWKREPERIAARVARTRATMGGLGRMLRRMILPAEKTGQETTLKNFQYARGGIENLVHPLVEGVRRKGGEIRCDTTVCSMTTRDNRIARIDCVDGSGAPVSFEPDFVFLTIPIDDAIRMTTGLPERLRDTASGLTFLSSVLVFAEIKRPSLGDDHWLYFPQSAPRVMRAYEPRNFDPDMAKPGRTLVCVEATAEEGSVEWAKPDEQLAREYLIELSSTGLFRMDEVDTAHVQRLPKAYPLYEIGYDARLCALWIGLQSVSNLIPLGRQGLFQHNNMDHTIYTGMRAARCWLNERDPVRHWHEREMPEFEKFRIID
jgi:protoporphyrinogen oxidase